MKAGGAERRTSSPVGPEITIPLQSVAESEVGLPEDYYKMILEEYSNRYLASLGVTPTPQSKAMVVKNMPLKECEIQASWASRSSAVADSLTILPPSSKKKLDNPAEKYGKEGNRQIELYDVRPPQKEYYKKAEEPSREEGLKKMERNLVEQDQRLSKDADINLTREFEEQKKKRAFEAQGSRKAEGSEDAELKQDQEKEVANLQRFLIPFACVEAKTGQLRSWRDPTFQMRLDVPGKEARRDVLLPIQILVGDLQQENDRYIKRLPLQMLTTVDLSDRKMRSRKQVILESLENPRQVRMMGLLAHFLYWTIFGHLHPSKALPEQHKMALFTAIHTVWSEIEEMKHTPWGVSFGLPLHLLLLKRGVLYAFTHQYQSLFKDEQVLRGLIDRINVCFMRLLDPENQYSRLGVFDVTSEGIRLRRQLALVEASQGWTPSQQTVATLHRCTTLTSSLYKEGAEDPQTRRLLRKNTATAVIRAAGDGEAPEAAELSTDWTRSMDSEHRVKLFNCAKNRLVQGPRVMVPKQRRHALPRETITATKGP